MVKQDKGLQRDTIDKYYTKINVVEECKIEILKYIAIHENDLIIEPSAGNGSFIKMIKELTMNHKFYDLIPENKEIIQQDFLILDVSEITKSYKKVHIIGNPPFGRQSSLAIKFIKKCCEFADTISFILPKSFKKNSNKGKFNRFFHLVYEKDLAENSFTINNNDCNVPCIFQIWKKERTERVIPDKLEPNSFQFVTKTEEHDISCRRVGVYAGRIDTKTNNKSIQSHYFIKFTNDKGVNENIKLLENIHFEFNNTVGPKSISKQELIKEFNKYI